MTGSRFSDFFILNVRFGDFPVFGRIQRGAHPPVNILVFPKNFDNFKEMLNISGLIRHLTSSSSDAQVTGNRHIFEN